MLTSNFFAAINQISTTFPSFPPLTQPEDIKSDEFCNENNLPSHCKPGEICQCNHLIKVEKGSIVELVVVDDNRGK